LGVIHGEVELANLHDDPELAGTRSEYAAMVSGNVLRAALSKQTDLTLEIFHLHFAAS
jgi:hypothetical protein